MMRSKAGAPASSAGDQSTGSSSSGGVGAVQPAAVAATAMHHHYHQEQEQQHRPVVPGAGPMSVAADAAYMSVPTILGEVEVEAGQPGSAGGRQENLQEAVGWMMERSQR